MEDDCESRVMAEGFQEKERRLHMDGYEAIILLVRGEVRIQNSITEE